MKVFVVLLISAFGQDLGDFDFDSIVSIADVSPEKALEFCEEFFKNNDSAGVVEVSELGAGGQSVVYKCSYNLGQEDEVLHALKLYRNPFGNNLFRRVLVDPVFGELGFGAVVSAFYYNETDVPPKCNDYETCGRESAGKLEQFLSGENPSTAQLTEYAEFTAAKLAKLHSIPSNAFSAELDRDFYMKYIWPWNTYLISDHLNQFEFLPGQDGVSAIYDEHFKNNSINGEIRIESFADMVQFADMLVTNKTSSPIVICHNDLHNNNIMIKDGAGGIEDRMIFIDYDNAAFGFRAFDLAYHFGHWVKWPTEEELLSFLTAYVNSFNSMESNNYVLTVEQLQDELNCHLPYVLFEQAMLYNYVGVDNTYLEDLQPYLQGYADGSIQCKGRSLPYQETTTKATSESTTENNADKLTASFTMLVLSLALLVTN